MKTGKLCLSLAVCLFFLAAADTAAAREYTLESAIARALRVNPSLEEKIAALESARMEIGVAQSYFWPRLSLVASRTRLKNSGSYGSVDELSNTSNAKGLRATWSLFAGFVHLNNLQRANIEKEIAAEELRHAELELIVNIQIQFFQLLQARRDLRYATESVRRIETQLEAAQSFADVGMAPYVNVLQNKVELSQARERVITIENTIRTAEIRLNRYLGHSQEEKISYVGVLEDYPRKDSYSEAEALELAGKNRPDIRIAQKSIEAAEKTALATAGEALPQVDLTSDWMASSRDYADRRYTDYERQYWSVGINVTWPFFEGGRTAFGLARDRKRVSGLRAAYRDSLAAARTDVLTALMDIRAAREVYQTALEGLKVAEENYAMANNRYNSNIGTVTELIDAQTSLTEAEARISRALAEFQSARAKLFFNMGVKNTSLR